MSTALFIYEAGRSMTLAHALTDFFAALGQGQKESDAAFALLYAPRRCYLARARKVGEGVQFFNAEGQIGHKEVEDVFEARVFNSVAELRWLNERNAEGRAVVLADAGGLRFFGDEPRQEGDIVNTLPQHYLLWGKSTQRSANGWTQFATARIGMFHVPLDGLSKGDHASFVAREYLKEYEDGNVGVAQERLIGLTKHESNAGG